MTKAGIAAPKQHVLRQCVEKHKARLLSEFARARVRAGVPSVEAWKDKINACTANALNGIEQDSGVSAVRRPRWVRVNSLRTNLQAELDSGAFQGWDRVEDITDLVPLLGTASHRYFLDRDILNLLVVTPNFDLTTYESYRCGKIILQDKASCFPATLLNLTLEDGDVMDTCAAPGNKTTHLAALMQTSRAKARGDARKVPKQSIYAVERDSERSGTLQNMVKVAGAAETVQCVCKQDFTKLDPKDARWKNVGALLLDPSCSGSGIVGRDEEDDETTPMIVLPRRASEIAKQEASASAKSRRKRKRGEGTCEPTQSDGLTTQNAVLANLTETRPASEPPESFLKPMARLKALSNFQVSVILHAFSFPYARKVIYSTCSIHAEENEHVLVRALQSDLAQERGWRVLRREEQVLEMKRWKLRGDADAIRNSCNESEVIMNDEWVQQVVEACLRCRKGTRDGTTGFFLVGFVRDGEAISYNKSGIRHPRPFHTINASVERETHASSDETDWEGLSET